MPRAQKLCNWLPCGLPLHNQSMTPFQIETFLESVSYAMKTLFRLLYDICVEDDQPETFKMLCTYALHVSHVQKHHIRHLNRFIPRRSVWMPAHLLKDANLNICLHQYFISVLPSCACCLEQYMKYLLWKKMPKQITVRNGPWERTWRSYYSRPALLNS